VNSAERGGAHPPGSFGGNQPGKLSRLRSGYSLSWKILLALVIALSAPRGDTTDVPQWKHYARLGLVEGQETTGGVGYYRLNRRTRYTFRDLRLFAYELDRNAYVYLRYKSSDRFHRLSYLYRFTTLAFQRNTRAGVALRYHYNQGMGLFLLDYRRGHINVELAHAYDMSDYLNDTRKTSYVKGGFYWDHDAPRFSTKLEVEYFYQISEVVEVNLTRTQLFGEVRLPLTGKLALVGGYEVEVYPGARRPNPASWSLVLGWRKPLTWSW
jgi:hypothetical protein